jgi:hypothetical protein
VLATAWDDRLDYIGVQYVPAHMTLAGYWRLVQAEWRDETESGGLPAIFVKALDEHGVPIENATFEVSRKGGDELHIYRPQTKDSIDGYWGNHPAFESLGAYAVQMDGRDSDAVIGLGCGREHPRDYAYTQFWLTFQWVPAPQPPYDRRDPYWRGR